MLDKIYPQKNLAHKNSAAHYKCSSQRRLKAASTQMQAVRQVQYNAKNGKKWQASHMRSIREQHVLRWLVGVMSKSSCLCCSLSR